MKQRLKPFPVKIQLLIALFGPSPAAAMIAPAFIQDKIGIRVSALLCVNRIGKRIPVEGLPFSEAGFKEVFSLLCPLPHCAAPDFGKQVLSPLLFLCDNRRLGQSVPAKHAEG